MPNIEQVAHAHRHALTMTDARPEDFARHIAQCESCGTIDRDAAAAHAFVNAYVLAHPDMPTEDIGDVLAYFEADITATPYDPEGSFWRAIANYFERRIAEVQR